LVVSDNAKAFKSVSRNLVQLCGSAEVTDYMSAIGIKWKFILEKYPWWGGFWERLVRTTKTALKKTFGNARVDLESLS